MDIVYTYGGGHLLYEVFNVLAGICRSDSPYWTSFLVPALMVGGLWAAVNATARANFGIFAKSWFIPTYALLTILLVPKTHLNIVDEVDPTFGSDRVDNIPVGLAVIATASSSLSRGLTQLMEDGFTTGDLMNFSKTGFAFSARLTQEARTMRIKDPRIRQNVKDWADQCVWLPYLKTNIRGKGEAARTSSDLLSWVEANAHPSLGIYWRNSDDGSKEYKTCRAAVIDIRQAMDAEGTKGIKTVVGHLFGLTPEDRSASEFNGIIEGAWGRLSKVTKTASQQVQQMMVVNAQKEALDDAREAHGYPRIHPELVSINAARNLESQGMAGFMKNLVGSTTMPLLQAFLFALLSVMFLLIIPFSFMPGGLKILSLWAKMMFSIQMWPVFSAILNALSINMLQRSAETVLDGGAGFSIATTSGLADAAFNIGGWAAGMQLMVPLIAWGFVSGGQFAITQIMQSSTGGMDGAATRLATEAVDGNLSLGNQNLMNETIASRSVNQQNNVGSHNYAEILNTGSQMVTQGENGHMTVQENQDTLRENFTSSGQLSSAIGNSLRDSQTMTEQKQNAFNKQLADTSSNMLAFAEKLSNGIAVAEGATQEERAGMQQMADETMRLAQDLAKKHGVSVQTSMNAALRASMGTGALGKLAGIDVSASGTLLSDSANHESMDKISNSAEGKQISQNVTKLQSWAQDRSARITDSSGADAASTLNHSLNATQSLGEAYSRSVVTTKNWEKIQSLNMQNTFGSNANENDAWLSFLSGKTGLSKADLVSRINQGGSDIEAYKAEFVAGKEAALRSVVGNGNHLLSDREIQEYLSQTPQINSTGRDMVQSALNESGLKPTQVLHNTFNAYTNEAEERVGANESHMNTMRGDIKSTHQMNDGAFEYANNRNNVTRAGDKIIKDVVGTSIGTYNDIFDNPLEGASNAWKSGPREVASPQMQSPSSAEGRKVFEALNTGGRK